MSLDVIILISFSLYRTATTGQEWYTKYLIAYRATAWANKLLINAPIEFSLLPVDSVPGLEAELTSFF